ncbi:MAG: NADH-quinone oxidoreductase subunit N [Gemmatimonadaceae bacterium]
MMPLDLSISTQLTAALTPDLIVMGGAMLLLLVSVWGPESASRARVVAVGTVLVCLAAIGAIVAMWLQGITALPGVIAIDNFRWASDIIFLVATIVTVMLAVDYAKRERMIVVESYVLLLLATSGMMLLAAARDLMLVFLGIELMSISVYVLAGLNRRSSKAAEAALKYFLLGAFSTGFLLYGIALIYGGTGSVNLQHIAAAIGARGALGNPMLMVGMALLLVGFGFKVAAVPFHMWTPDVYEGAPTPFTAYMAAAVKAAAFAAFLRVWIEAFPNARAAWLGPVTGLAIATMFGGNIIALAQKNMKRLLAYSSIAHAGYLLLAVAAGTPRGASAFLFYLVAYTLATMGAFGVVIALARYGEKNENIADYAGLWQTRPALALAMAVFMLALLGFPIAGGIGFFAKWYVLQAAIEGPVPMVWPSVALVVASMISAGYYLNVTIVMFMQPRPAGAPEPERTPALTELVIGATAIVILVLGIFPSRVVQWTCESVPGATLGTPCQVEAPSAALGPQR